MSANFPVIGVFLVWIVLGCDCGPPQFEVNPQYSDAYLPAAMQVIAYLTETMKYELRPQQQPTATTPTTTSTPRPTAAHRPGLFQPSSPPPHRDLKSLIFRSSEDNLGAIIRKLEPRLPSGGLHELDLELLGDGPKSLHRVNQQLASPTLEHFLSVYDDDATNSNLIGVLRQRKTPPTRAYVTLLTLYDLLNKETKRLNLNRFNGYSARVLAELQRTSHGTSRDQLKFVLRKMQEKRETLDPMIESKLKTLLGDLDKEDSYICMALQYIPPLFFAN